MARKGSSPTSRRASKAAKRKAKRSDAAEPSPYTVFISHSSKERWIAKQIAKEIKAIGVKTWLDDTDLDGGDEIESTITRAIQESQEVLVVISMNSSMSQWVIYEAAIAKVKKRRITPVYNNVGADLIAPLRGIKGYDLNDSDKFLLELKARAERRKGARK